MDYFYAALYVLFELKYLSKKKKKNLKKESLTHLGWHEVEINHENFCFGGEL